MTNVILDPLTEALKDAELCDLAGERSFSRGRDYFQQELVRSIRRRGGGVEARVQGTESYRVRLRLEEGELEYDCTCPVGRDGLFCKHCVAVGLALRAGDPPIDETEEPDLKAWALCLDKEEIIDLLLDYAEEDERLHRKLMIRAAQSAGGALDLKAWRDAFSSAVSTGGGMSYHEAYAYTRDIDEVIDSLDEMFDAGRARDVIGLAEYALRELEDALVNVDDSEGEGYALLERLQTIHLEACQLSPPNPEDLAELLFEWEMDADYDTFYRAAETYAEILGKKGLAVYRRLAEAEWKKIAPLEPGERDENRYDSKRFRITAIMEALAKKDGGLDALVKVKSRDLSKPHDFRNIADLYLQAGDSARALEWAERGWKAFAKTYRGESLRVLLIDLYKNENRHDEAIALAWEAFSPSPHIDAYKLLEKTAKRARQWPAWRDKALSHIRKKLPAIGKKRNSRSNSLGNATAGRSLLVEIFLYENDVEAAWTEAKAGGCYAHHWLELARRREKSHPVDAVRIYEKHIGALLQSTGNQIYTECGRYLEKIKKLRTRMGEGPKFKAFIADLRGTQKRKRNLIKMLEDKKF